MAFKVLFFSALAVIFSIVFAPSVYALTANQIYQQDKADYQNNLSKISDPAKKQAVIESTALLAQINYEVCTNYATEVNKMAAILDEEKQRLKINNTRVAYGAGNTPMDQAEYYVNYAEEAVAYQKGLYFLPDISGNLASGVQGSLNELTSDLNGLNGKMQKAKDETQQALDYYAAK